VACHDIPVAKIRERFDASRKNLIALLPKLRELHLHDNSVEGDPQAGLAPAPRLVVHCRERRALLARTPAWAKPIVAAALKLHVAQR
jgi:hypothetical protein